MDKKQSDIIFNGLLLLSFGILIGGALAFASGSITGAVISVSPTDCYCNHTVLNITSNGSETTQVISCAEIVCR